MIGFKKFHNPDTKPEGAAVPEVDVKGTRIHFSEKDGAGIFPVLFVHGGGGNAGVWERVMDGLSGFHSIAVDLPGHGESRGEGKRSVQEYSEFINDFSNVLRLEKFVLGGHSLGGAVVLEYAIRNPEKLRAILLVGTGARLRVLPAALDILKKMADGEIPAKFEPWAFSDKASSEVLAEGEREWVKTSAQVRYSDMLACDQFDVTAEVGKILCPTLIVCGREDRLTPIKYSEFLKQKISASKMEIIDGAAHTSMLENPGAVALAISNFLRSIS